HRAQPPFGVPVLAEGAGRPTDRRAQHVKRAARYTVLRVTIDDNARDPVRTFGGIAIGIKTSLVDVGIKPVELLHNPRAAVRALHRHVPFVEEPLIYEVAPGVIGSFQTRNAIAVADRCTRSAEITFACRIAERIIVDLAAGPSVRMRS